MKLKNLFEEWKKYIKVKGETFGVYINPDSKELLEIKKEHPENAYRYILSIKKPLIYVFSAKLLHFFVAQEFKIPYSPYYDETNINEDYLFYFSEIEKGKLKLPHEDIKNIKKAIKKNGESYKKFIEKYFINI